MDVRCYLRSCGSLLCFFCLTVTGVHGQELLVSEDRPLSETSRLTDRYYCGEKALQLMVGPYFSPVGVGPHPHIDFDFLPIQARLGCMLYDPIQIIGSIHANGEVLLDVTAAPVLKGPGNYVVGPSLLLRGNFLCPGCPLVPYLQAGGGIVFNDVYHDPVQHLIGRVNEFYLTGVAGLHYQLSPSWSFDVEGGYGHISNADTARRNAGVNGFGGTVGLTYTFGHCRK
jgi:hypothetical protein